MTVAEITQYYLLLLYHDFQRTPYSATKIWNKNTRTIITNNTNIIIIVGELLFLLLPPTKPRCQPIKYSTPRSISMQSTNIGQYQQQGRTCWADRRWFIASFVFLQTCYFTIRSYQIGSKIPLDDGDRMAQFRCTTKSRLGSLYDARPRTSCYTVQTTQNWSYGSSQSGDHRYNDNNNNDRSNSNYKHKQCVCSRLAGGIRINRSLTMSSAIYKFIKGKIFVQLANDCFLS